MKIGELLSVNEEVEVQSIKGKGTLLVKIIFDVDNQRLDCEFLSCRYKQGKILLDDKERLAEYLWIGNDVGMKPQRRLTTDKVEYLLDPSKKNKWAIKKIIEEIDVMECADVDLQNLKNILNEIIISFFPSGQSLILDLDKLLAQKGVEKSDIALYTVSIRKNGVTLDLVKAEGYRRFIRRILYETESEKWPIVYGRCHVCGKLGRILSNPAYPEGTLLCMYNVDKLGFMPGLSDAPEMTACAHAVCPECKEKLRLGLNFIERQLRVQFGNGKLNAFIVPTILGAGLTRKYLEKLTQATKDAFSTIKAYESLKKVEELMREISEIFREQGQSISAYSINILFGYRTSSHFAYQYLIQNVPMTRLIEIAEKAANVSSEASEFIIGEWGMGIDDIYSIFPLRETRKNVEWKPFVELLNAMLSSTLFDWQDVIARAVLFARICKYGAEAGYTVKAPQKNAEIYMCEGIFKYNLLFKLLREIGVVESMNEATLEVCVPDAKLNQFISMQGYTESQRSLFLLGYLIGKIGVAQYNKGDERKSVLNKVNFEGMSAERIKLLANYVLDGLRNYRLLNAYNEEIYSCMKAMLDRHIGKLQDPVDNTFYLLSGYAYATLQAIKSGGETAYE